MTDKYFASGGVLPWKLAEAWADLNNIAHTSSDFSQFEKQMRAVIEAGVGAGIIQKRCRPSYAPCGNDVLFEDCSFSWDEIRAWVAKYLGETWPVIPPWRRDSTNSSPEIEALSDALASYFETASTEKYPFPADLHGRVRRAFVPKPFGDGAWGELSPSERRASAEKWDQANTPERQREDAYWFNLGVEINTVKREISEWEGMSHQGIPSEAVLKEQKLNTLRANLAILNGRWDLPPFSDGTARPLGDALTLTHSGEPLTPEVPVPPNKKAATAKGRIKWDEGKWRQLYTESIQPGATTATLARQYGMTSQGIGKQIKKAEEMCRVGKKQPRPTSVDWKRGK